MNTPLDQARTLIGFGASPPKAIAIALRDAGKGSTSIGGWFDCRIDAATFASQNPSARLWSNTYQRWLIAVAGDRPASDVDVLFNLKTMLLNPAFSKAGLRYSSLKLVSVSTSAPTSNMLSGAKETARVDLSQLHFGSPAGSPATSGASPGYYAVVEFWYEGTASEIRPWPWAARGFFTKCPEDVIAGLVAVMSPREPTEAELASEQNVLEQLAEPAKAVGREVTQALRLVLWGGAAVLVWQIFRATNVVKRGVVG